MKMRHNDPINIAIRENGIQARDWALNDLARLMYRWVNIFNEHFFKDQPVPIPALSFEKTRVTTLGHYVIGRNAFGLKGNININRSHLNRPMWNTLATLLHEMCHSWQHIYGKPSRSWFHNKEYRAKMTDTGILVNERGRHFGIKEPFIGLLKKHGIEVKGEPNPDGTINIPSNPKPKGKSKLKKWTCGCQTVRVGRETLEATCEICGNRFYLVQ